MAWTPDNRLLLAGKLPGAAAGEGEVLALWPPGAAALDLRPIVLPPLAYQFGLRDPLCF